jgi:hypothetical protein
MLTLSGTLRQSGVVTIKEKPMLKIWVEHESPRDNGTPDLKIEELFLDQSHEKNLPAKGASIEVIVRPYPSGRGVAYSAVSLATGKAKAA